MSELKTNKVSPVTGTAFTLGDSGDTFTLPSGATLTVSGTSTIASLGASTASGTLSMADNIISRPEIKDYS